MKKLAIAVAALIVVMAIAIYYNISSQPDRELGAPITGVYVYVGNPTFGEIAIPGMVYAINADNLSGWGADTIDKYIYLTNENLGGIYDLLWTNEPNIPVGTVVSVLGEVWYRRDVAGRTITLLEYTRIEVFP